MAPWMYFVGWGLTCVGFGLTLGLFLRKERKDNAVLQAKADAEAKANQAKAKADADANQAKAKAEAEAKLLHRLDELEKEQVAAEVEREVQNNVLDKMSTLHEQVIRVMAGHDGTRREIDDLKESVRDIRQELRHLRTPHPSTNGS